MTGLISCPVCGTLCLTPNVLDIKVCYMDTELEQKDVLCVQIFFVVDNMAYVITENSNNTWYVYSVQQQ